MTVDLGGPGLVIGALVGLASLLTAAGVIWRKLVKPVREFLHDVRQFFTDWNGEPADDLRGYPERKSVMERLKAIEHEVQTNGGGSLKDDVREQGKAVRRIETSLGESLTKQREMIVTLIGQDSKLGRHFREADARDARIDALEAKVDRIGPLEAKVDQLMARVEEWQGEDRVKAEVLEASLHEVLAADVPPNGAVDYTEST